MSKTLAMTPQDQIRFWSRVDKRGECWEWVRGKFPSGYGAFWIHGRQEYAHRLAYFSSTGQHPGPLEVRHTCDNRACVRPDHLVLGTHADNMRDMAERGRAARLSGEAGPSAKMTWALVDAIRQMAKEGVGVREIGRRVGVSHTSVGNVLQGKSWKSGGQERA